MRKRRAKARGVRRAACGKSDGCVRARRGVIYGAQRARAQRVMRALCAYRRRRDMRDSARKRGKKMRVRARSASDARHYLPHEYRHHHDVAYHLHHHRLILPTSTSNTPISSRRHLNIDDVITFHARAEQKEAARRGVMREARECDDAFDAADAADATLRDASRQMPPTYARCRCAAAATMPHADIRYDAASAPLT